MSMIDSGNLSYHVHCDSQSTSVNGLERPGQFVLFENGGGQRVYVNLDDSLRRQLMHLLMTDDEREAFDRGRRA